MRLNQLPTMLLKLMFAVFFFANDCRAVNPGFLPGNAYFMAALGQDQVDDLAVDGNSSVEFRYRSPPGMGYMCGYVGFFGLKIEGIPPQDMERFQQVYTYLRRHAENKVVSINANDDGTETSYEVNPFYLLIYPRDFNHTRFKLGLNYNENWPKPLGKYGFSRQPHPGIYVTFFPEYDALLEDWRNAEAVPELKVSYPDGTDWREIGSMLETPATVQYSDLVFYVISLEEIANLYKETESSWFVRISGDDVTMFSWESELDEDTLEEEKKLIGKPLVLSKELTKQK